MNIKTKKDLKKFDNLVSGCNKQIEDVDNLEVYILESLNNLSHKDLNLESYAAQQSLAKIVAKDIRRLAKKKNWWEKKFLLV